MRLLSSTLLIVLCAGIPSLLAAPSPGDEEENRLDIDVYEAPAEVVLKGLADALGMVSGGIEGRQDLEVTMTLQNVTARTALNAMSESLGCDRRFRAPERSVTLICEDREESRSEGGSAGSMGLERKLDLSLRDAPLREVLAALGRATEHEIEMPKEIAEKKVTLEVQDTPARRLLDVLCRTHGCSWERTSGSTIEISVSER